VALIWHIRLLFNLHEHWKWAKHELTYLVAHPLLFAPAIGLVCSIEPDLVPDLAKWELAMGVAFILIALGVTIVDQWRLRQYPLSNYVRFTETWFFMSVVAAYLWYAAVIFLREGYMDPVVFIRLATSSVLMALWIPLRIYADLAVPFAGDEEELRKALGVHDTWIGLEEQPAFALVIFIMCLFVFAVFAVAAHGPHLPVAAVTFGLSVAVAIVVALVVKQKSWVPPLFQLIEAMNAFMFPVLAFVAELIIMLLARTLLH
jgi:hypothetical protein